MLETRHSARCAAPYISDRCFYNGRGVALGRDLGGMHRNTQSVMTARRSGPILHSCLAWRSPVCSTSAPIPTSTTISLRNSRHF